MPPELTFHCHTHYGGVRGKSAARGISSPLPVCHAKLSHITENIYHVGQCEHCHSRLDNNAAVLSCALSRLKGSEKDAWMRPYDPTPLSNLVEIIPKVSYNDCADWKPTTDTVLQRLPGLRPPHRPTLKAKAAVIRRALMRKVHSTLGDSFDMIGQPASLTRAGGVTRVYYPHIRSVRF